jgi:HEAT repeat protein
VRVSVQLLGVTAKQPWFYGSMAAVAFVLLFLNVLVLAVVYGRRLRQTFRSRRERRFRARFEQVLGQLEAQADSRDSTWLRKELSRFDELERPIAAVMLVERLGPESEEERGQTLEALREVGAIPLVISSLRSWIPWRRALAAKLLGSLGADEAVPVLLDRLGDPNRRVRESVARALGRIGDRRALPQLGELFRTPGLVGTGVAYDSLIAFGQEAEPVFAGALRSEIESVRISACFGVAALGDPEAARRGLEPLLADPSAPVRAAAAESLAQVGSGSLPEGLARASRDEEPTVRSAAAAGLGSYDDPRAVEIALNALLDPDRDTAVRAAESLVRLSRRPAAGPVAAAALERAHGEWPAERALAFASLGVV